MSSLWKTGLRAMIGLVCASPALAAQIVPIEQRREVRGFVINPLCAPNTSSHGVSADDFSPFGEQILITLNCDAATGQTGERQQSEINALAIVASGAADSQVAAEEHTVLHAIGWTDFEVAFTLAEPTEFVLMGELRAARAGNTGQGANAGVALLGPGDLPIVTFFAQAPETGEAVQPVAAEGPLQPGTYRLVSSANAIIDSTVPPDGNGQAEFVFRFSLSERCASDLNGDGVVDLLDLSRMLAEFGCAGAACLADVDATGQVDLTDLAQLLSDFGVACP